jgi:hypothetical protein
MPCRFTEHDGVTILDCDLSRIRDRDRALFEIRPCAASWPTQPKRRHLRMLTNVAESTWDAEVLKAMRAMAAHNEPWVLASAILGINPIPRVAMRGMLFMTGRQIAVFADEAGAKVARPAAHTARVSPHLNQ